MQKLKKFLREVLIGGIYLIFPLTLLIYIIRMAHDFVASMIRPLSDALPDIIPGYDGSVLLAAVVLVNLCFLGGILLLNKNNRSRFDVFERSVLMAIPGYNKMKLSASIMINDPQVNIQVVAIHGSDTISLGLLVETDGDWCTVYHPAHRMSVQVRSNSTGAAVTKTDISAKDLIMSMKSRGLSAQALLIRKLVKDFGPGQSEQHRSNRTPAVCAPRVIQWCDFSACAELISSVRAAQHKAFHPAPKRNVHAWNGTAGRTFQPTSVLFRITGHRAIRSAKDSSV